ncbi:ABC transporter ATP-binding protein [Maritimibacter alkaliphilus]|uniref:ABC transporter ATP-binding protein n=1 Tax=Maritimibacter alkaliphilus TaxID=404236 RepID=UPI001C944ED4|nr:ABC transporter ATP-binding protein [Maritimibacter alkaliphilus]MBY6091012.1 ABC transporter ATP-binding protein [Maritimibacter alkaliphilus]
MTRPLLETVDLKKHYGGTRKLLQRPKPLVKAVDGIDLQLAPGEVLGLVGESGCGKSTLARTLLGLERETEGTITFDGQDVGGRGASAAREIRSDIQYVHQDPGAALDPWWRIGDTLHETLKIHGVTDKAERDARIEEMLLAVGLNDSFRRRYPHELSGGQQRRVGLARTLSLRPRLVILDEPTSGLDLSVQATVLKLMLELRAQYDLTYLFISHDLSVVERLCDRVAIMYLGRIVEIGAAEQVFSKPAHPYTQALLASAPTLERQEAGKPIEGDPPSPTNRPEGCPFHPRCPMAEAACRQVVPDLADLAAAHRVACPPALRTLTPQ